MTFSRTRSVVFLSLGLLSLPAAAYIRTTTGQGTPITRSDSSGIQVLVNTSMKPGEQNADAKVIITASSDPMGAVAAAANEWTHVPTTALVFNAPQPTALSNNPNDGQYVITIEDNANNRSIVGGTTGALAVTLFSYNGSGVITDSDIIFNPTDAFSTDETGGTTDLQSVLVHEMGHSLGANHSPVISATMFQAQPSCSQPGDTDCVLHHTLSADDAAFASNAYPGASAATQLGSITGSVALTNATAVGGALVVAVDPTQGTTIGGLSNLQTGAYRLDDIPPGNYLVYAQPANGPVMPGNLQINITNTTFRTTFAGGNQSPTSLTLTAGGTGTANISVDIPQTALQIALLGRGPVGQDGFYAYSGGALSLPSGSSTDLLLWGPGLDSTVTQSQIRLLGPGITLRSNTLHPDNSSSVSINGTSYRPLRFTVDISPLASTAPITVAVVNGTDAAAYSGGLVALGSATPLSSLTISKSHIGVFTQGQTSGASYTLTVGNAASAAVATSGTVSVTDNPPTGMSVALITGAGWACIANACTRTDALAPGASYPPLTVNVNIALTAASQLTNQVTVTGGNSPSASATDVTTIEPAVVGAVTVSGITNAAGFQTVIPSGSFVSVYGSNLSPINYDDWSKLIVNGKLPTQIDGVSLTIGGKPAYIFQISPTQINAQAPDIGSGPVQVIVTTPNGVSPGFTATGALYNPAFWPWPNKQPVATHPDYSIAAKNGSFSGLTTVPAKPGEIITLWGTGFGPTSPAVPAGQIPGTAAGSQTQFPVTVALNGSGVTVLGAAISSYPADYQVAIQIPASMAAGDYPLVATINGVSTPQVTLTVAP